MFDIITPTYNRAHLLHRVYDSLKAQSYRGFRWLIVDDASSDDTNTLVEKWQAESNDFEISYFQLAQNQGKPRAVNFGLENCNQAITIIADSDDTFSSNALERIKTLWDEINKSHQNIAAIWTLVLDEDGKVKGDRFPEDHWVVGFKERVLERNKQLTGDKWTSWRTKILQAHPLYFDTDSHVEESQTWNRINKSYDFLCVNESFLTAHVSPNSLITSKKSRKQVARSGYYSAYYALKDVKTKEILNYSYYRTEAFNYLKSWLFYSDHRLKLTFPKLMTCLLVFLLYIPKRIIKRF